MLRLLADENLNGDIVRGLLLRQPDLDIARAGRRPRRRGGPGRPGLGRRESASGKGGVLPNRRLAPEELARAQVLLDWIRAQLLSLSGGDPDLLFAYRRKVYKELTYDERDKPMVRRQLKAKKRFEQNGL